MLPLFSSFNLKGIPVKNRVIMPPMVCFGYAGDDGFVTRRNLHHYRERAEGGAGIIVTEAACIRKEGRTANSQLGIWSDDHIEGLSHIPEIVKSYGAVSLIQLHHAGLIAPESVTEQPVAPSLNPNYPNARSLTVEEIHGLRDDFIRAAVRAQQAGFDGVQLHGAHGYLLSQFASTFYNRREDDYGTILKNRMRLACEIIDGIREACGESMLLTYRMGANSPTLADGIAIAHLLEQKPIDMLDVSHGGSMVTLPRPPKGFDYNWICYSGTVIRQEVGIPVGVVNEIRTPERANYLIENNLADFVNLGRPILADPHWVSKAQHHEEMIVACLNCRPRCKWYTDSAHCPALQIRMKKELY
ncbi:MAG: NADH:flavin oxidoreductase [Bacteroidetes bacterium]|nr:MAG: NADH:flavin oxidoreductase [Bacteroidota bacterium]